MRYAAIYQANFVASNRSRTALLQDFRVSVANCIASALPEAWTLKWIRFCRLIASQTKCRGRKPG
jgi:hypothetical protein